MDTVSEFEEIEPQLGSGSPAPKGWQPVSALPLLILVGTMGAGKSTTVNALLDTGCQFHLLPNRRVLTNLLIVAPLQREENLPVQTLDRNGRLPFIRRYKERHPAGLAYALSQMVINLTPEDPTCEKFFLFDGLRGDKEIFYAAKAMPRAIFALLDTPDIIRIKRILDRQDPYDRFFPEGGNPNTAASARHLVSFAEIGEPKAAQMFTVQEEQELLGMVNMGEITAEELRDKLHLILVERNLYDMRTTVGALRSAAPDRTLFVDTTRYTPVQIAEQVVSHLRDADMI